MLQLQGAAALSSFRIAKLLGLLQAREPSITGLHTRFVHFVDLERPLADAESTILEGLLTYGPRMDEGEVQSEAQAGETLIVVPRAGTISPWSSKATDIAQVCGLTAIRRIEAGTADGIQT